MPDPVVVTQNPQVTPAAPAPAPAEPVSQVAPVEPQKTLADAQVTPQVTMPEVAQAAQPAPAPTPAPETVSPEDKAKEEQRVKDAQRKMHEATSEASKLRTQLQQILNHPTLGPVVKQVVEPAAGTPASPGDEALKKAWKDYQSAPNDEEAFRVLMATAEQRSRDRVLNEIREQEIQRTNDARAKQRDTLVAQAINAEVAEKAPDIPLELFWAMSTRAELETPANLLTQPEKLEWQVNRSMQLAREVIDKRTRQAVDAVNQNNANRQTAAPVMPAGSTGASGSPGSAPRVTFVDQLKAAQARKVTS